MSHLPPSQTAEKIVVRLPDGMRDRLAEVAKANGRSVNAEVVARLEQSFDLHAKFDAEEIVNRIVERIERAYEKRGNREESST